MRAPFVEHASGDQNRKSALVSGAIVETVCTLCHIGLSAYHRASPNVGWSRSRAVLMLTAFYLRQQRPGGMARKFGT